MTREIFLDAVLREVRFSLDHDEIRAELTAHLEDEGEYLAARDGLTTSEAEAEAVRRMGDAKTLGKELNKAHDPWIGRLWVLTSILMVAALFVYGIGALDVYKNLRAGYYRDTRTGIERQYSEGNNQILFHVKCGETVSFVGFQVKFTDIYGVETNGNKEWSFLEIVYTQSGKDGEAFMSYAPLESFLNADGKLYGSTQREILYSSISAPGQKFLRQGTIRLPLDPDHPQIYLRFDQFGQHAEGVLDFSEGVEQLKEKGYFDETEGDAKQSDVQAAAADAQTKDPAQSDPDSAGGLCAGFAAAKRVCAYFGRGTGSSIEQTTRHAAAL